MPSGRAADHQLRGTNERSGTTERGKWADRQTKDGIGGRRTKVERGEANREGRVPAGRKGGVAGNQRMTWYAEGDCRKHIERKIAGWVAVWGPNNQRVEIETKGAASVEIRRKFSGRRLGGWRRGWVGPAALGQNGAHIASIAMDFRGDVHDSAPLLAGYTVDVGAPSKQCPTSCRPRARWWFAVA